MKKYINIKKLMQDHVRNAQLAAVAVMGLGIALFCSAYSVPEGCTPSVTVTANQNNGNCGTAIVGASCIGDDTSDTVTANDNGGGGLTLPFISDSGEACDSTGWGWTDSDFATAITLVTGLNKITATSSELGITSPEVDIVSKGANGPSVTITATWTSSGWWGGCGDNVIFDFSCLKANENYSWSEVVTRSGTCPWCGLGGSPYPFTSDNFGYGSVPDSSQTLCPSQVTANCQCSNYQTWTLTDTGPAGSGTTLTGNTTRTKKSTLGPPKTSTIDFSSN
ncbi:MAG TPA: hypothetical protein VIK35_10620 [Verrucomicrobiae bacterium]